MEETWKDCRACGIHIDMTNLHNPVLTHWSLLLLPTLAALGCSPRVDIAQTGTGGSGAGGMQSTGGTAATGGAPASTGGGTATGGTSSTSIAGTGGIANPSGTGVSVCGSPTTGAQATVDLATVQMGDACSDADACSPGPGICVCTGGQIPGTDTSAVLACVAHRVQMVTSIKLDVDGNGAYDAADAGASWGDCDSGLTLGHSGETCTWARGDCSRPTDDPCCIELATCNWMDSAPPLPPVGILERYRFCAPGCQNVVPDTTQATVADCATAGTLGICEFAAPCQAGLVCTEVAGGAPGVPINDPSVDGVGTVSWCADGMLVGGFVCEENPL